MKKVKLDFETQLHCIPLRNNKVKRIVSETHPHLLILEVQLNYTGLIALAASFINSRKYKQYALNGLSQELYERIDGKITVEKLVLDLAENEKLGFMEARALMVEYLKSLMERGLVVVVTPDELDQQQEDDQ
jgi:hypothetical protein